ncbi:baseplate J/gp47 family protein [Pseudarthrobacter defluvii]|uniref:baseplate J/gp47 family protein n=1 Tax=Pseudarthrobacter defluvii TaxID=410837 RepID=UPI0027D8F90A|nr:baseplate J/gp47 family protein [Pseudarthrobacter defluvii]
MTGRLSSSDLPALRRLTARMLQEQLDPAMALLEGWSCLSHILNFYNERLVNEHYLRTCTDRRSAVELARLVGYAPRPGVAADAYLAFTLDDMDKQAVLHVPRGTRAYSQPGPGETMQPFETSEELSGRPRWNEMLPRLTKPQRILPSSRVLYFKGISTGLRKGDTLLLEGVFQPDERPLRAVAAAVEALPGQDRTRVELDSESPRPEATGPAPISKALLESLIQRPSLYTGTRERLQLRPEDIFTQNSYAAYGLLEASYPQLKEHLGAALGGTTLGAAEAGVRIYAMRIKAALHGNNAALIPVYKGEPGVVTGYREWNADGTGPMHKDGVISLTEPAGTGPGATEADGTMTGTETAGGAAAPEALLRGDEVVVLGRDELALDAVYDQILPESRVMIVRPGAPDAKGRGEERVDVYAVKNVRTMSRTNFILPSRVTVLTLDAPWLREEEDIAVRGTVIYAHSELLEPVEVPIQEPVAKDRLELDDYLELDGYYEGLHPGRRVLVTGERSDLGGSGKKPTVSGVRTAELLMITAVKHLARNDVDGQASKDTIHTYLSFAEPGLKFSYRRDTVRLCGNVAPATHGESRVELLGSGDAGRALQQFSLKQGPLTYVAAPTPDGVQSTLQVIVNDIRWQEEPNPAAAAAGERRYVLKTDDGGGTAVVIGLGARLPTGTNNVKALYRSGLGSAGNVKAGQISVLATRPQGVTGVLNPLAASGGADHDGVESIRRRTPVGLAALDRLVSASDLADFARAFAGIGKASLVSSENPGTKNPAPLAYSLILAGENDVPLSEESALIGNLRESLRKFGGFRPGPGDVLKTPGNPAVTLRLRIRKALLLGMRAQVRLQEGHVWEAVLPRIQAALFGAFGFEAREIGQVARPGEAMAVIQTVRGVAWVNLQAFGAISTGTPDSPSIPQDVAQRAKDLLTGDSASAPVVGPGDIAYLSPAAPGTMLLTPFEVTS